MSAELPVLVVGAGPVGLTAATILAHLKVPCRIVDKNSGPVSESRALGMQARTLELFERIGLVSPLIERGILGQGIRIFHDGNEAAHVNFAHLDTPYPCILFIEQSRTERVLIEHLATLGVTVERPAELVGLSQDQSGVTSVVRHGDGREESVRSAFLIGCDGAHSTVRNQVGIEFAGEPLPGTFLIADVRINCDWPRDEARAYLGTQGVVLAFPIPGGLWRLAGPLDRALADGAGQATLELAARLFQERCPRAPHISDPAWLALFHINSRVANRFRAGRVFLAGDSAHIHSPLGGQGMNTGIQDAFNLCWKLQANLSSWGGESLLDSYQQERQPNALALVQATEKATQFIASPSLVPSTLRTVALSLLGNFDFLRDIAARELSELPIHYRRGPLSENHTQSLPEWLHAGTQRQSRPWLGDCLDFALGPHAGDRAPDAAGLCRDPSQTRRLFEWWQHDLRHQLLIFGGDTAERQRLAQLTDLARALASKHGNQLNAALVRRGLAYVGDEPVLCDTQGIAHHRFGARFECLYLVRPDGYVGFRSQPVDQAALERYLASTLRL